MEEVKRDVFMQRLLEGVLDELVLMNTLSNRVRCATFWWCCLQKSENYNVGGTK